MLEDPTVPGVALAYLALMFAVAWYADRRADGGRPIGRNAYVYTLSMAVYCTAWTFYGSVGRAAGGGVAFLPIYLGPTLMLALGWLVLRKMVRIAKHQRITSIADFIGSRYGKSALLGGMVTVIAVVGILPYIALQLKAVVVSFNLLHGLPAASASAAGPLWRDSALWVALLMAAFTIVFGTRHIDASERHEGMVVAIAFESVVKLAAFLAVGVYVSYVLFDGPASIFERAGADPGLAPLLTLGHLSGGDWLLLTLVSMCAIVCLPRQFQVAVVENVDEGHVRRASWLLPAYLLVINLFVLPIAFAGVLLYPGGSVDPDTFVLTIPMNAGADGLALLVFIGGLSAATGMLVVETIALSTMVCNDLVLPALLRAGGLAVGRRDIASLLLGIRRGSIVAVLLLGYLYYRLIGESYALVTIGLVSFVAAFQFAPPIVAAMYWRGAYSLLLPGFARSGWLPAGFLEHGAFGVEWLRPYALFGFSDLDPIAHATFWSLLANAGTLVVVSLFSRQSAIERVQAALFADPFRLGGESDAAAWGGTATVAELRGLLARFLGAGRADAALAGHGFDAGVDEDAEADQALIAQVERLLAGAVGAASARALVASTVRGEVPSIDHLMQILDETSQVMEYSRRLEQQSRELEAATRELREANRRLQELDRMKDEFVSTVSHELRTPLTSIRAFSEILRDNDDLDAAQRREFLGIVVGEAERLTRLVNEILDLAKIEAGRMEWRIERLDLREPVQSTIAAVRQLYAGGGVALEGTLPPDPVVVRGDRDRLAQVMTNLLGNAEKFCPRGTGRVRVCLEVAGAEALITVADNGPGIPGDQLEHVFDRFHQVAGTGYGKGTGLGLAISHRIVTHLGGDVRADSEEGKGTVITVRLPLAIADAAH
jgi:Na+/proline symporter/signal transduction histidine kinase